MHTDFIVLGNPFISTILLASVLASFWLAMWIIVLFVATYHTNSIDETILAKTFISALILSTVAEAGIRIGEQSRFSERYSLGDLRSGSVFFTFWKAFAIFLLGMWWVANLDALFGPLPSEEEFKLAGASGEPGDMKNMISRWYSQFKNSPAMTNWLILCFVMRIWVYKRNHKTEDWQRTALHVKRRRHLLKLLKRDHASNNNHIINRITLPKIFRSKNLAQKEI